MRRLIRHHVYLAGLFAEFVEQDPEFELVTAPSLNLVCFARRAGDEENRALLQRLNASGKLFMSHTVVRGRYCLRFCVGQTYSTEEHVRRAWQLILDFSR